MWNDVVKNISSHAIETESNSELPTFLSKIYQRGVDAGFGEEDASRISKSINWIEVEAKHFRRRQLERR